MAKTSAKQATRQALPQIDGKALRKHVQRSVLLIADAWANDVVDVLDDTTASVGNDIVTRLRSAATDAFWTAARLRAVSARPTRGAAAVVAARSTPGREWR